MKRRRPTTVQDVELAATDAWFSWGTVAAAAVGVAGLGAIAYGYLWTRRMKLGLPIQNDEGVRSGWGDDRSYRGGVHEGIDFFAPVGTPIYAAEDGVLEQAFVAPDGNAGLMAVIRHDAGGAAGLRTRYLHLSSVYYPVGTQLRKGQGFAASGETGSASGQPQLHFDVRADDAALSRYMSRYGAPASGFPDHGEDGWAVPAEPLVPAKYQDHVVATAAQQGVVFS